MRKALTRLPLLMLALLSLSGCWDRTEINDLAFILTTAIDLEEDGSIRYSVLVPLPGSMGGASGGGGGTAGDKRYYIDSEVGDTFRDAQAKLQKRMSRRMFLAHRRTLVVGAEYAKKGIRDLFDASARAAESRMSTYLIVSKGKAYELLQANPQFEMFPSEAIRELVKARTVIDMNIKDIALSLSTPGSDPVVVYLGVKESEESSKRSKEVEFIGYSQFRDDKMVGTLEGRSAVGLALLKNESVTSYVTIPLEEKKQITASIYESRSRIKTKLTGGKLTYDIKVETKSKVVESTDYYDLSQKKKIDKVEQLIAAHLKNSIEETLKKEINKEADSANFGSHLWRTYPRVWKQTYEKDWPQGLKEAEFHIHVKNTLSETGLIFENVTKGGSSK
ncbi:MULTISPECIES: Ger(x)C family spore germination protein [unclassified Paenibacillus]|uniref:Ger(x)C family spore germination protein n=1 Tax=unclassified Paenibacillus TaxID=185978 RepID=UPI001AE4C53D|nr:MULTISPECIES: Ger(x)C family spore germination protein [unclassified Paenibacillus]MBP1153836.1 Ger(x)C family germination protein [Paenibacillus sp. PvP091]MBP1170779.1 Ger(x)C family germination protein [Paenibacillus sp. PvR098]MBP2441807.1 Ger(x)C family germination protein [Paenibacillus sp. PvP052]